VTSITYVDADGDSTVLSSSLYQTDTSAEPAVIRAAYGETWPVVRGETLQAVIVRAVVGYGIPAAVPAAIVQGILLAIGTLFAHREDLIVGTIAAKLPQAAEHLFDLHAVRPRAA